MEDAETVRRCVGIFDKLDVHAEAFQTMEPEGSLAQQVFDDARGKNQRDVLRSIAPLVATDPPFDFATTELGRRI